MSWSRSTEDEGEKKCHSDLFFFKQLASEKCRLVPSWFGGPGNEYKLLHGSKECSQASENYINLLEKCANFPKPK